MMDLCPNRQMQESQMESNMTVKIANEQYSSERQ